MKVESNVRAVLDRMTRLKSRDLPAALKAARAPDAWREPARRAAQTTLEAVAQAGQRQYIPDFLRTLLVGSFGDGFFLRLHNPFPAAATVKDFQAARGAVSLADGNMNLFLNDVQKFDELMAEWVAEEKRKDRRDAGKTDADIGNWLAYELLAPDGGHRVASGPNKGRSVREVFMPHIVDFLQRKAAAGRLDAATVDLWLRAVLAAWRQLVRDLFPDLFRAALRAQVSELALGSAKP